MPSSRRPDYLPYALGGAIVLLGMLSVGSVLMSPVDAPAAGESNRPGQAAPLPKAAARPAAPDTLVTPAAARPESAPSPAADAATAAVVMARLAPPAAATPAPPVPLAEAAPVASPTPVTLPAQVPAAAPVPARTEAKPTAPRSTARKPSLQRSSPVLAAAAPAYPRMPRADTPVMPAGLPALPAGLPPVSAMQGGPAPTEGPRAFSAPPAPAAPSSASPAAESKPARPVQTDTGPAVVAASGNKVWIRVDERRTISLEPGQALEGYGAFIGVSRGNAKFERGTITSKTE
jgi:hypothetical protein